MDTPEQTMEASLDASREQSRILVVDDDVRLRNLLQRFLEEQGFTVRVAPDAVQMDKLLSRELYALMVLDFMLPGEDGLAICRRSASRQQQYSHHHAHRQGRGCRPHLRP
jgi:CheY-like chemotaxis protein